MSGRPSSPPGKPSSVTASGSSSAPASTPSSLNRLSNESWISRSRERILALPPPGSTASGSSSSSSSPVSDYFLWKLYNLVEDRDTDGVISWNDDGSGFIISQPSLFEKDLLPNHFFIHKTFSAFVRQLTIVLGFVKAGGDRWEFSRNDFRRRRPMFDSTDLVTSRKVDQSGSSDEEPLSLTDESLDGYEYLMQGLEENIGSDGTREYYYSCTAPLCFARKLVTTDLDGKIAGVTYDGRHTHVRPRFPLHCPLPRSAIQLPRSKMVEEVEKEHMFDKVVTPSDVGKLNRLVIPKHHAEKYFPLDVSSNEQGLLLNFEDSNGKPWRFRHSNWNSSQSYVMTKGWSRFVKEKNLDAGDIISFQRGAGEDSRNRFFIDRKRHPTIGTHPDFPMVHHLDLDGNVDDVTYGGHHSHHPKPQPERVPNQNTSLQSVSEQSCVTTEADEIETAYNKDKAREVVLKRFVAKRSKEGEDDEEQQLDHKSSTFSSVMDDTFKGDSPLNIVSSLEPLFRRVVREEVQHNLSKLDLVPLAGRSSANRIEGTDGRNLQLHFRTDFSSTLFTEAKVEGEHDDAVHIVLLDANSGHVVTSGPESSIKLDVVALDGDFQYEDDEDWTQKEFQTHVVNQREGRRLLLTGDLQVTLKEGVGTLGDLAFTDNSSWIRSRKLRLGLKVASGFFEGIRIREARTQAFIVKDHRSGLYKKHSPPLLNDEVWRLEKIGKDGVFHNRLNNHEIFTVKDFLRLMARDSAKLRNILGSGMSGRSWDALQNHAKTCVLDEKINAEEYFPVGSLLDEHIDTLVKKAYGNRIDVEYDGKSQLSLKQSKGSSGSDDDYQGLANIEEVQGAHTVGSTGRKNRHSKVWTAKGIRDRRIRLSVHTAIRFYNLQDRLGYYQPSKAVEWLIKAAKTAVDQLAVLCEPSAISATETRSAVASQPPQCREDEPQKSQKQQEPQQSGCGSSWDSNSPIDSLTWPQLYLYPSTGHGRTLIPFTCKPMDPQGTRPRLTFLQEPVRIKEVHDVHIFGPTKSRDGYRMVQTAGGIRDRRVRLSVHAAILLFDIQDRLGYDRPSKVVDWLMEKSDAAINVLDELSTAAAITKTQSAATNQPPQLNEVEPQKSQQQESRQSGCGSGWDLNSPVEFLTFQHQLDPSAVHLPGSSFIQPSLDSDAIADTIKSFFPMSSSGSGRGSEMMPSQNLFQSHPIPSLLKYIKEIQDMRLCVSGITNIDLGADSLTRFFGMSKLKVHNLFCKVPRSLPSFFQADNFVELHLPHYNHRLLWAGKLGLVNLQLINLKHSSKLISLPDLSMAQKIVHLNLRGCVKLIQVSYIQNLTKLEKLNLRNCENIKVLPSLMGLQNLKEFYLSGCTNLRELPPSIIALNSLVVLDLKNCARLYELPMITSGLPSLQKLNISGCTNILRSLDMKGNRESHRSYGRFLSSTISGRHGYERDSQFVEEATAPKPKKCTTKKAKKISSLEVVQVEIIEEKDLRTKNINWIANMEKEERKRKSVESASTICKEVRVKRTCNSSDDFVSSICQPSHEAVKKAFLDSGSKLIGDTEPAPVDRAPNLTENTLSGLAIEDSTSGGGEDVGLGIQMQPEAISLCNSSDHPGKECTGIVPLDVSKTAAPCDPHKLAEKSCDGGMESNTEVFNHQPKETKPLSSYKENDEIDWLKNEIQKLQKQLEASEKRRDGFRECYDSLESELWPLRAELEVERVNLTEQKQKHEESELEASIAWEDLKELVAQTIF